MLDVHKPIEDLDENSAFISRIKFRRLGENASSFPPIPEKYSVEIAWK